MIRLAAAADLHYDLNSGGKLKEHLERVHETADLLLLGGDLTQIGDPEEAQVLAKDLSVVKIPVVSVLGNHDYHSDRVGTLLRAYVIEQLIAQGVRKYDFLGGEPGYKARWAARLTEYLNLHFARKRSVGALYLNIVKNAISGKELLRRTLPGFAWDLLHNLHVGLTGKETNGLAVEKSGRSA